MNIAIATLGHEVWNRRLREEYADLARRDSVGKHTLVDDEADADIVAIVDFHQHADDPHLSVLTGHPLTRRDRHKLRVIDERDRPFFTFPGIYVSWPTGARGTGSVRGGCYHRLQTVAEPDEEVEPDLLFSFLGARTHRVRESVMALRHARAVVEDTSSLDFFDYALTESRRASAQARYRDVLARSKFVLCPRGHGTSSFRLFETLSAGRVPVVISDAWMPPPGPDWEACSIRIRERDVADIAAVLEAHEDNWPTMAKAAAECWSSYFAQDRRWNHFGETLSSLPARRLRAPRLQRERIRLRVLGARDKVLSLRRR